MQVCQSTGCLEFLYKGKKKNLLAFRCLLSMLYRNQCRFCGMENFESNVVVLDHSNAALYLKFLKKQSDRSSVSRVQKRFCEDDTFRAKVRNFILFCYYRFRNH